MTDYTKIFYTVPLLSKQMLRDPDSGLKVDENGNPPSLPAWSQYTNTKQTSNTPLLAAIALKDFIGVDIDDTNMFEYFLSLLPTPLRGYVAESDVKGGHILYRYTDEDYNILLPVVKILKDRKIDVQMGRKLIYLATPANKTKKLLTPPLPSIKELPFMPKLIRDTLLAMATETLISDLERIDKTFNPNIKATPRLQTDLYGFLLEHDMEEKLYVSALTPKKDFPHIQYMNDIPEGMGTEWMLQVRKKLQIDPSIDANSMLEVMLYLNSLWDVPMDINRIKRDVERDVNSSDFYYHKEWKSFGLFMSTIKGATLELLYVPTTGQSILYDRTHQTLDIYLSTTQMLDAVASRTGTVLAKSTFLKQATPVDLVDDPSQPSFFIPGATVSKIDRFNVFMPTRGLELIHNPHTLEGYRKPKLILGFFKNLIPHKPTRDKFLGFLAYKYMTFNYSPLYFIMQGVGGAGKGVLVHEILEYISGDRIANATAEMLTGNFNGFLANKDWLELEEIGEGIGKLTMELVVGTLKRITGNPNLSITYKGKESISIPHSLTPILSTNIRSKFFTDDPDQDRRMVLLKCPNKLVDLLPMDYRTLAGEKVVITTTGEYLTYLRAELPHFSVWLSDYYKTDPLSEIDYMSNEAWKSADYNEYVDLILEEIEKLYIALEKNETKQVRDILLKADVPEAEVDLLLSLPNNKILVKHTTATRPYNIKSLEEILLQYFNGTPKGIMHFTKPIRRRVPIEFNGQIIGDAWIIPIYTGK